MLRVLHEYQAGDHTQLLEETTRMRGEVGCRSAELYRSIGSAASFALATVWEDEPAYWRWWAGVVGGSYPNLFSLVSTGQPSEFYHQQGFQLADSVWAPADLDEGARKIFWPARGPVRIIIETAFEASEALRGGLLADVAETRREPGCVAYDWLENVELPGHLLLLELWSDQVIYDRHWAIRLSTAGFRGNPPPMVAPQRGALTAEFYRHQQFRHQYDRWMPDEVSLYATAVSWPAS
ncbi:antibiotic biosynthesis monooxygenase [Mycolicibacterium holsaticum]|uniref:antibiotic biosynthesis monooxygenase n=1 Tax=Mycolicibacterium holsaticum TaxID=152142 RepID=UPI001C7D962C|nr:antibiotic biosynthesis monooxygenase [Mycolicibacterium holsaticum]MDA4109386.1 antibiotic biosynthesis monooxygenase [Mycolicibacterium holsaticum DSM 44478 = JCM 12374]QZA11764.1 antibiotic biosynthesis monooxygenase [Mycolicibacterium holsaticum DSM 44478 = JCM 12374]UNC10749.1 antibiotic biosynthesis monooxygenase [Mycolicibacterium holsaticum DSM 44478 = JCM 12374]